MTNNELREISEGDSYSSEQGAEYLFQILGNKYNVGYGLQLYKHWAQAECYESNWCYCNDKHVNADEVYNLIENYKSVIRDNKLETLGI
jgi:hypothetical protein